MPLYAETVDSGRHDEDKNRHELFAFFSVPLPAPHLLAFCYICKPVKRRHFVVDFARSRFSGGNSNKQLMVALKS